MIRQSKLTKCLAKTRKKSALMHFNQCFDIHIMKQCLSFLMCIINIDFDCKVVWTVPLIEVMVHKLDS